MPFWGPWTDDVISFDFSAFVTPTRSVDPPNVLIAAGWNNGGLSAPVFGDPNTVGFATLDATTRADGYVPVGPASLPPNVDNIEFESDFGSELPGGPFVGVSYGAKAMSDGALAPGTGTGTDIAITYYYGGPPGTINPPGGSNPTRTVSAGSMAGWTLFDTVSTAWNAYGSSEPPTYSADALVPCSITTGAVYLTLGGYNGVVGTSTPGHIDGELSHASWQVWWNALGWAYQPPRYRLHYTSTPPLLARARTEVGWGTPPLLQKGRHTPLLLARPHL